VAFFLLYRIVPHRTVPWRHALIGGIVAAFLFEAAKQLFAVYVRYAAAYNVVYGTFSAVPVFLIWVYLSWLVILFGAELTASLDYWRSGLWKRVSTPGTRFGDAVAVARRLFEARGASVPFERLRLDTGMPVDELEDALHHMTAAGLVQRHGRTGYSIAQAPREPAAPQPPVRKAKRGRGRTARSSR
jgi:membrane protein